jgi:hypothetical protein
MTVVVGLVSTLILTSGVAKAQTCAQRAPNLTATEFEVCVAGEKIRFANKMMKICTGYRDQSSPEARECLRDLHTMIREIELDQQRLRDLR